MPQQGDGGIDFIGERILFDVPRLKLRHRSFIVGQGKARNDARGRNALEEFGEDPLKMLRTVWQKYRPVPSLLMFVTSRQRSAADRRETADLMVKDVRTPAIYIGLDELESIISANLQELRPLFDQDRKSVV